MAGIGTACVAHHLRCAICRNHAVRNFHSLAGFDLLSHSFFLIFIYLTTHPLTARIPVTNLFTPVPRREAIQPRPLPRPYHTIPCHTVPSHITSSTYSLSTDPDPCKRTSVCSTSDLHQSHCVCQWKGVIYLSCHAVTWHAILYPPIHATAIATPGRATLGRRGGKPA